MFFIHIYLPSGDFAFYRFLACLSQRPVYVDCRFSCLFLCLSKYLYLSIIPESTSRFIHTNCPVDPAVRLHPHI